MDLCSLWLPLDDATVENGCMAVVPGAHTLGPLPHVHVRDDYVIEDGALEVGRATLLPMRAGSGLFFTRACRT
ncbi:MAG: phytanoyl-CoA dioxygenase family protein, partial [Chloroflexota bacterium]